MTEDRINLNLYDSFPISYPSSVIRRLTSVI
jgi:hypothetical protein